MAEADDPLLSCIEQNDHVRVAALLEQDCRLLPDDFVQAVRQKSYSILELFLQHGYNINEPLGRDRPSALG